MSSFSGTCQMEKYARDEKLETIKNYAEVESAKESNRPIFNQMVKDLRQSKVKGIIFHKIDRASRNFKDAALFDDLIKEGYDIHFASDRISSGHPNWRLAAIQFGLAKFYLDNLKQEIEKGTMGMLARGLLPNPCPTGYLDKGLGVKVPDPVQSKLVRLAFEYYSTGNYNLFTITDKMVKLGMKNKAGKPICYKTMQKVLRHSFYYGIVTYREVPYPGSHEPIITKRLFDKVQEVLSQKGYKHVSSSYYIFQNLILCPICGNRLRSVTSKKRYKYYSCRDKQCTFKTIREPDVEDSFLYELKKLEFNDKEVQVFLKAIKQFKTDLQGSQETDIRQIEMEEAKVKQQLEDLMMDFFDKKFTDEEHRFLKTKLLNKQKDLAERRTALSKADERICADIEKIGKLLKKPIIAYRNASEEKKRELVKSLVENFSWTTKNDHKTLVIIWKNEFQIVANRNQKETGGAGEQ